MPDTITKQWELGQTISMSATSLIDLIRSVSVDDVQPQAVIAADQLGSSIRFSSELYSKAILALRGNESFRKENLKFLVGLNYGGTIKAIRNSTSLIAFFLFVCAWKPCYLDSEIGDLAFQMMTHSSILTKFPVASFQLCSLINSFSGHTEALIPVDSIHELATALSECAPLTIGFSRRMDMVALGKILVRIFTLLMDESVSAITLLGQEGGIWLASFFWFLIPQDTVLYVDGKIIKGSDKSSKLRLELISTYETVKDSWTIKEWKNEHPTTFIVTRDQRAVEECSYMPLILTKNYFHQYYAGQFGEPIITTSLIGEVAGALVILLSESGSVYQSENCCERSDQKCKKRLLFEIFPDSWMKECNCLMKRYGWDDSIALGQSRLVEILRPEFEQPTDRIKEGKEFWARVKSQIRFFLEDRLGKDYSNDYSEEEVEMMYEQITEPASYIAIDAVTTATCHFESGTRRIAPLSKMAMRSIDDCFESFLSPNGMEVCEYRRLALAQVLPGNSPFDDSDIVVSSNGYVASINHLWKTNIQRHDALTFRVERGVIKRDGFSYKSVREDKGFLVENFGQKVREHLEPFRGDEYLGLRPRHEDDKLVVQMAVAVVGTRLDLKTYLTVHDEYLLPLSWTDSVECLAFTEHQTDNFGLTVRQEKELARRYRSILNQSYWKSCHTWGPEDSGQRTILKTLDDPLLRFFCCGLLYRQRQIRNLEKCFTVVLRHSGHLLSSLLAAEETGEAWAVIC